MSMVRVKKGSALLLLFFLFSPFFLEAMHINRAAARLEFLWRNIAWHILGLMAGALVLPYLLRSLKSLQAGPPGKLLLLLLLLLACGFTTLVLFGLPALGPALQIPAFSYLAFVRGVMLPLALLLFFHIFPPTRRGLMLGLTFAALELIWFVLGANLDISAGTATSQAELVASGSLLHQVRILLHAGAVWTSALSLILWAMPAIGPAGSGDEAREKTPAVPQYRQAFHLNVALAIALCCYVLSALLNNSLGYVIRYAAVSEAVHVLLGCIFIGTGVFIDRAGAKGMRLIIAACCFTYLLFPILPQVAGDGTLFSMLHNIEYLAAPVFFLSMLLLLGRGPYEGRLPGLLCVAVYLMRLLSFFGLSAAPRASAHSLFWSTVAAALIAGLLFLSSRFKHRHDETRPEAGAEKQPVRRLEQISFEEFVFRHDISQRKRELLRLLLQGSSTRKIAADMGITPYTVRLHIHEILRATGLKNRKDLMNVIKYKQ